jgi:hypothetical protein
MGIEPTSEAREARDKTLKVIDLAAFSFLNDGLNWKLDGNRNGHPAKIHRFPFVANLSGMQSVRRLASRAIAPVLGESQQIAAGRFSIPSVA